MIDMSTLQKDDEIVALLKQGEQQLEYMGYTEHSERHRQIVARRVARILKTMGCDENTCRLGEIAAYLHDIGCAINRHAHAQSGALLAYDLLRSRGMEATEATLVANGIANHDEQHGFPSTAIAAALILADKSDVHKNRVRKDKLDEHRRLIDYEDIHDRVNFSVLDSKLIIDTEGKKIIFQFQLDSNVSSAMDYFEIFLGRMKMCQNAAKFFGLEVNLEINGQIRA